jgi:hypothetical protein
MNWRGTLTDLAAHLEAQGFGRAQWPPAELRKEALKWADRADLVDIFGAWLERTPEAQAFLDARLGLAKAPSVDPGPAVVFRCHGPGGWLFVRLLDAVGGILKVQEEQFTLGKVGRMFDLSIDRVHPDDQERVAQAAQQLPGSLAKVTFDNPLPGGDRAATDQETTDPLEP